MIDLSSKTLKINEAKSQFFNNIKEDSNKKSLLKIINLIAKLDSDDLNKLRYSINNLVPNCSSKKQKNILTQLISYIKKINNILYDADISKWECHSKKAGITLHALYRYLERKHKIDMKKLTQYAKNDIETNHPKNAIYGDKGIIITFLSDDMLIK